MSKQKLKNDVEILDFLERLREDGIKIWAEGDKIRYRVINSQLPLEVLENIKRSKKELLDFFTMVEKNEVPLTSMQLAYIVGQKPECELSDINAHYYIEFKTSELDIERLEKAINIVITRAYWLNRIKDLPESPTLPKDGRAADKGKDPREFYRFQRRIDKTIWERIKRTSGEYGVTVSAVLIGLYAEVIARWSENKHFIINLPVQNRNSMISDIDNIVGDFTTVNLLEVNLTRSISFVERVKEIASRLLEDLEHNSFTGITRDVPENAMVAGNPAKIIRKLDD